MRAKQHPAAHAAIAISLLLVISSCDEPETVGTEKTQGINPGAPKPAAHVHAPGVTPGAPFQQEESGLVDAAPLALIEDDFVEQEANRDPFRNFASLFISKLPSVPQRAVAISTTPVDEMRLVAIVTGIEPPRVMIADKSGVGHIVRRGDYVGRAEVIQVGGVEGVPVTLNWRVEAIRANEVILSREDPTAPNQPPITRRLLLYENETKPKLSM